MDDIKNHRIEILTYAYRKHEYGVIFFDVPIKPCQVLKDGLTAVHVPYSYGFAIILLTVLVKIATFPLTKQQVS